MPYQFTFTKGFQKHFQKLTPTEKTQLKRKLELFSQSPMHPSLRTKHIQGTDQLYEFSVNMDIRVIWQYANGRIIVLLDVGHHDILELY
ncbi:MAG: cytotoxin [Firmicutes bacterium]|nr:cytotoxin [Bacillota bacterium]